MGIISVTLSRLCIFSPRLPPLFQKKKEKKITRQPALSQKIMETDCTERMCRARLARNRECSWANGFLGRALSCYYTLTCLTILLPLNPVVLALSTHSYRAARRRADLMHRDATQIRWKLRKNCLIFQLCPTAYTECCFILPFFSFMISPVLQLSLCIS